MGAFGICASSHEIFVRGLVFSIFAISVANFPSCLGSRVSLRGRVGRAQYQSYLRSTFVKACCTIRKARYLKLDYLMEQSTHPPLR